MKYHVEQLRMLWQLQELEQKILLQEDELHNIASVSEHQQKKDELFTLSKVLQEKGNRLAAAKKEQRRKEFELQSALDLLERLQHKLYSGEVYQARELENLEKKVQASRKEISGLEDDVLQFMEDIEQGEEELSAGQKKQAGEKRALQQLKMRAREDIQTAQGKLKLLKGQREDLRQSIDATLLGKYSELSSHLRGRSISLVQKGFCGICNVSLPSSFRARMLTPGELVFCENCGCLLVPGD